MKVISLAVLVLILAMAPSLVADTGALKGTWSGNWTPKGGVPDAITIELHQESSSTPLTGKFLNPAPMDFSKVTFNAKTALVTIEATDEKTGKHYKLEGRVDGNEIKGTLTGGDVSGEVRLIK